MSSPQTELSAVSGTLPVSGTYLSRADSRDDRVANTLAAYETVRLDVDGSFPQMMASGSYQRSLLSLAKPTSWVAHPLREVSSGTWEGPILRVWGDPRQVPHAKVRIQVPLHRARAFKTRMTVTFFGGPPPVSRILEFYSSFFREVVFEFDSVEGSSRLTVVDTCAHPQHPPTLLCETLTFDTVYERAGVDVTRYPRHSTVPLSRAGGDMTWSDAELNDAMKTYWSSYSDAPNWAVWTLFAGRHDPIVDHGNVSFYMGIMFDYAGQNQRQGCALFNDQLDDHVPSGEPNRDADVARLRFYDLVHETAHCFNLRHAWLGRPFGWQWPFENDLSAVATFMNYPDEERIRNFFGKFEYQFHESELKFLRHAPENLVEMGDEAFPPTPGVTAGGLVGPWKLELTLHRAERVFQFLEPVTLTLRLTHTGRGPRIVDASILHDEGNFALVIARGEGRSRLWRPFAQRCLSSPPRVLAPGESLSASFFVGAGLGGWYLAEPGPYTLQALLNTPESMVLSEPVTLRIAAACSWQEEVLAQDWFTHDVGRALAFGGTRTMTAAVATLHEAVARLPERAVSHHAALALALPLMRDYRVLRSASGTGVSGFELEPANHEGARRLANHALFANQEAARQAFGRMCHQEHVDRYAAWLERNGATAEGEKARAHVRGGAGEVGASPNTLRGTQRETS